MGVTTIDIARICNVSRGTVDRALNNKPRIDPATKARILEKAKELGYRPDLLARSLATGRTHSLGVVVFDVRNQFFAQLLNSIGTEARKSGYFVNINLQEDDPELEIRLIQGLVDRRADGLILCPVGKGEAFESFLKSLSIPVVMVGNRVSADIPFVGIDEVQAAWEATNFVLSKGWERVVFVCPPLANRDRENIHTHEMRLDGFRSAMAARPEVESAVIGDWEYPAKAEELLKGSSKRTAFFCTSDVYALELLARFRKAGLKVPADVGLMGFDNVDTLRFLTPRLSTVFNPIDEFGRRAVQTLLDLVRGKPVELDQRLNFHLVPGETL